MFAWDADDDYDIDMKYVLLAVWCHPPPRPPSSAHFDIIRDYGGQTKQMPRDNNLLGLISNYASDSRARGPSSATTLPLPFPLHPRQLSRLQPWVYFIT